MDKRELIEKLTSNRDKCFEEANKYKVLSWDRQIVDAKALVYMQVINWFEQLDEQPKVTVPKFVAEWFEEHKYSLNDSLWDLTIQTNENSQNKDKKLTAFEKWFIDFEYSYEYLIRMKNGYEVEKEPVYEVAFFESDDERYLLMELGEKSYEVVPESENDGYRTQWFTESEIKSIDERYWAFAVPVEEAQ